MSRPMLSPYVRIAWDHTADDLNWYLPPRVIFDYEIIYLAQGEMDLMVEGKHYHVTSGAFIILRPGQRHSIRSVGTELVRQPHVHFDLIEDENSPRVYISFEDMNDIAPKEYYLFRKDILDEFYPNIPPVVYLDNAKTLYGLLMSIIREKEKRVVYSEELVNGLFMQMFSLMLREISMKDLHAARQESSQKQGDDIAQQVQEFLNNNLNRDISLDELAESIHISKYYLCRQFKQVFGVSPMQYHLDSRISRAKWLLASTQLPISTIAEMVGFQSIYSFSCAFKKRENVSPSVYRR